MSTFIKNIIFFCVLNLGGIAHAQNLVINPSFENHKTCPRFLSNFNSDSADWSTTSRGTTDYFHSCGETMGIPNNFNGFQKAKSGKAYAGLYLYAPNDYREYVQGELQQELTKNLSYKVSFYVSLAETSDYALKDLSVLFSDTELNIPTDKTISKSILAKNKAANTYLMPIVSQQFYGNSKKWELISLEYVAKGGEKYVSIGNFKDNKRTRKIKPKNIGPKPNKKQKGLVSYYYIDMVSVQVAAEEEVEKEVIAYTLDTPHVFKNVLFDFDTAILTDTAKKEIARVYNYLKKDSAFQIHIIGHTDAKGSISYNATLAKKRAKKVANYLIGLGLPKGKITWQGKGGELPIAPNTDEEGRKQNRRVEFTISEITNSKLPQANSKRP